MKITEKEKKNREKLFKLMQENPDLPVIPMVDEEIVADDCSMRWMGSWGDARIDELLTTKERIYFRNYNDEEEILTALHGWEWVEAASDEEWKTAYENVPWITAIIVNIDLPEI